MNTTIVKTKKGRSIMIQHDVTSPRPYSRLHQSAEPKDMRRNIPIQKWPKVMVG
jgi:hypothetical protein